MKIAQYKDSSVSNTNKSFQKELWDQNWENRTFETQVNELQLNPTYWRLLERLKKSDVILEAGCGFGQWVYALNHLGYPIIGIDIAEKTLVKIKKKYPLLKLKIADVEKLPFKDQQFDAYLSFGVIEHFPDGPQKVLNEARRVLKENGLLYLTVPYLTPLRLLKSLTSKQKERQFYQYLYSQGEIKKIIEDSGFVIEKIEKYDFITAFRKDFSFTYKLLMSLSKINRKPKNKTGNSITHNLEKPNFTLQKLLYKFDSYILLIEARKSD